MTVHSLKSIRVLASVLLCLFIYFLARGLWGLFDDFIRPWLAPGRPGWPFVLFLPSASITLLYMAVQLGCAGKAWEWVRAGQSRGWWLAGTLFAYLVFSSLTSILQMLLLNVGPAGESMATLNHWRFVASVVRLLLAAGMLALLARESLMAGLGVDTRRKKAAIGKLLWYGFALYLLMIVLTMVVTSIIAFILNGAF